MRRSAVSAGVLISSLIAAGSAQAAVTSVTVAGTGALPAQLAPAPFGPGAKIILDRNTVARAADFQPDTGKLRLGGPPTAAFPSYLNGREYVYVSQNNRGIADFSMTINVDTLSYAYLLLDNRVDGIFGVQVDADSEYTDPTLQSATQWILDDGWVRMNTGLSPNYNGNPQGDWVGIDEGAEGNLNQFYAIYRKAVIGSVTLYAQDNNNMYAVVVAPVPEPASLGLVLLASGMALLRRRSGLHRA